MKLPYDDATAKVILKIWNAIYMKLASINWFIRINSIQYENSFAQFLPKKTIPVDFNLQP